MEEVSEDVLVCISHATQERLRDVLEKLTEISRHRIEILKVCSIKLINPASHYIVVVMEMFVVVVRITTIIGCSRRYVTSCGYWSPLIALSASGSWRETTNKLYVLPRVGPKEQIPRELQRLGKKPSR